jgi:hypothetical protein
MQPGGCINDKSNRIPADRRPEAFRMNDGGWTIQMKNIENHVAAGA